MSKEQQPVPAIIFILLGVIVAAISSLGAPLIPEVSSYFHVNNMLGKWSLTIALISSTVSVPILAKVITYGRYKTTFFIVLCLAFIGCLICGFTMNYYYFLVGRALQGFSLGLIPSLMIAAQDILPDPKEVISFLAITTAVGLGIFYPLSGYIVSRMGVPHTFQLYSIFAFILALVSLKLVNVKKAISDFDYYGACLLALLLIFLLLLLDVFERHFDITHFFAYLTGVMLSLLLLRKRIDNCRYPIISKRILQQSYSRQANMISFLTGALVYILFTSIIIRIQQTSAPGLSYSALIAGLALSPSTASTFIAKKYFGFKEVSNYQRCLIGTTCIATAFLLFMYLRGGLVFNFLSIAMGGYGVGLIFPSVAMVIKENLDKSQAAEAYSLSQLSRIIGYSFGSIISINIISTFFLNQQGEPGRYSYIMLGLVSLLISAVLFIALVLIKRKYGK